MSTKSSTTREFLIASLSGTTFAVPDLEAMIAHWPADTNVHLESSAIEVNGRLEGLFPPSKRLQKMKLADFALFAATWWPYASFEDLCVVTHLCTWLFAWDDELDSAEYSNLIHDMDQATAFAEDTIRYIRVCLEDDCYESVNVQNPIITDITRVCDAVKRRYPPEKTRVFCYELVYFVQYCQAEQRYQLQGDIPSAQEYFRQRLYLGAVRVCYALAELTLNIILPCDIIADADMTIIMDGTNLIIFLMNDILSFKKEFSQGQVDTILPILLLEHGSVDKAIDIVSDTIIKAVRSVDEAGERLLQRHGQDMELCQNLTAIIDSCKYACTGNLNWSLMCDRYDICQTTTKGGFLITLPSTIRTE